MKKNITEKIKEEMKLYYLTEPMTIESVAKKFSVSKLTAQRILKDIPKYTKSKIFNSNLKERYFENIDSEDKAYFLGLILTDGNVFSSEKYHMQASISITLNEHEKYILEKFKECIGVNTKITYANKNCYYIAVRSNLIASDLKQYGIIPCKTFKTYLPIIHEKYMNHLIRGIFDGDGCMFFTLNCKRKTQKSIQSISFCGTHQLMQDIATYFENHIHLKFIPKVYDYKNKNLAELKIQNTTDVYTIGEWIYKDSTIYFTRKKDIYNSFCDFLKKNNTELT